jgi:hypothetical protein
MVYVNNSDELYHYGVKGMRWGHRKASYQNTATRPGNSALRQRYLDAEANKKAANKAFNKAYNKAYNRSISGLSPIKKHRQANDERWADAFEKGKTAKAADKAYKNVKKERKAAIKSTYKQLQKEATFAEKLKGNDATRKLAATYIVDNDMTVSEAKNKAYGVAKRNTAIILGTYGAVAVGAALANRR